MLFSLFLMNRETRPSVRGVPTSRATSRAERRRPVTRNHRNRHLASSPPTRRRLRRRKADWQPDEAGPAGRLFLRNSAGRCRLGRAPRPPGRRPRGVTMSTPASDSPRNQHEVICASADTILVDAQGPEDTTRRPLRPSIRRGRPGKPPDAHPPAVEQPSTIPPPPPEKS